MAGMDKWIWGGVAGVIGFVGLFVVSYSDAGTPGYWGGLAISTLAVLIVFFLVKRAMDRAERQ
jgi:hypothetical protein